MSRKKRERTTTMTLQDLDKLWQEMPGETKSNLHFRSIHSGQEQAQTAAFWLSRLQSMAKYQQACLDVVSRQVSEQQKRVAPVHLWHLWRRRIIWNFFIIAGYLLFSYIYTRKYIDFLLYIRLGILWFVFIHGGLWVLRRSRGKAIQPPLFAHHHEYSIPFDALHKVIIPAMTSLTKQLGENSPLFLAADFLPLYHKDHALSGIDLAGEGYRQNLLCLGTPCQNQGVALFRITLYRQRTMPTQGGESRYIYSDPANPGKTVILHETCLQRTWLFFQFQLDLPGVTNEEVIRFWNEIEGYQIQQEEGVTNISATHLWSVPQTSEKADAPGGGMEEGPCLDEYENYPSIHTGIEFFQGVIAHLQTWQKLFLDQLYCLQGLFPATVNATSTDRLVSDFWSGPKVDKDAVTALPNRSNSMFIGITPFFDAGSYERSDRLCQTTMDHLMEPEWLQK